MGKFLENLQDDLHDWGWGWYVYLEKRFKRFGTKFEANKDILVDILMARRGTYQRPFLHFSLVMLLVVGIVGAPVLANFYPGALPKTLDDYTPASAVLTSLDAAETGIQTQLSDKPRDQVIIHKVEQGDT